MIKNIIVLPNGTEISSGAGYGIKQSASCRMVNDDNELLLGSVCANKVSFTIYDVGGTLSLGAGGEITLYREANGVRVKKGVYRLEKPTRPTANTMKITGYDRVVKLDKDLTDWVNSLTGWPYNILTFARMVCEECGLSFVTTEAPNMDFQVYQFTKTGVTGRKIMRWLAEICCRFCRANDDGDIEFAWYTPSGVTIRPTGNRYYFQGALSFEAYQVAPVEAVQIQLADSSAGALWPTVDSGLNSYIISGNAVVNARITEELGPYLQVIKEQLTNVTYTPCKLSIPTCLDIDAGTTVSIVDKNGVQITAYVMTKTTTGQKDTIECTGSPRRDSPGAINSRPQSADQAFSDAFAGLTQAQVFNKWTDNGKIQGIYAQDGRWYINAEIARITHLQIGGDQLPDDVAFTSEIPTSLSQLLNDMGYQDQTGVVTIINGTVNADYVNTLALSAKVLQTGILTSQDGTTFYLDLDNGVLKMNATSLTLAGNAISDVIDDRLRNAGVGDPITQEDVFNTLTNYGTLKGIFLENGELYVNASYIKSGTLVADLIRTGVLQSDDGTTFYLDLDNGILKGQFTDLSISGKTVEAIAEDAAGSAVAAQTQADIFNKLTNNGEIQGIYAENGYWYINAEVAKITNLTVGKESLPADIAYTSEIPDTLAQLLSDEDSAAAKGVVTIIDGVVDADYVNALALKVKAANIEGVLAVGQLPEGVAYKTDIPEHLSDLVNDSGYLNETGVVSIIDGVVDADYVSALGITAKYIVVTTSSGSVLFQAGDSTVKIAGWNVDENSFYSGDTFSESDCFLCTGSTGSGMSIAGSPKLTGWMIKAGSNFGVTKSGAAYMSDAYVQGEVKATSGDIGGWEIVDTGLYVGNMTYLYTDGTFCFNPATNYWCGLMETEEKSGIYVFTLGPSTKLKIGNTTLSEADLIKLLALIY